MGVHETHCCRKHGCKYGDLDCPVAFGTHPGIKCEFCEEDEMYESEIEDELEIPHQDEKIIADYGAFIAEQLRHQYRMGVLQGLRIAREQVTKEKAKYGR